MAIRKLKRISQEIFRIESQHGKTNYVQQMLRIFITAQIIVKITVTSTDNVSENPHILKLLKQLHSNSCSETPTSTEGGRLCSKSTSKNQL